MSEEDLQRVLDGKHDGWQETAVYAILQAAGYQVVGSEGAWRSWKHVEDPRVITIWMPPGRPVYRKYVEKVAVHVKAVRERQNQ